MFFLAEMGVAVECTKGYVDVREGEMEWCDHILLYVFHRVAVFDYFQLVDSIEYSRMAYIQCFSFHLFE